MQFISALRGPSLVLGLLLCALAFAGCAKKIGEKCSSAKHCATGLYCSDSGFTKGLCTADCTSKTDCTHFGSNYTCAGDDGQCVKICEKQIDCPSGYSCTANKCKKGWQVAP